MPSKLRTTSFSVLMMLHTVVISNCHGCQTVVVLYASMLNVQLVQELDECDVLKIPCFYCRNFIYTNTLLVNQR